MEDNLSKYFKTKKFQKAFQRQVSKTTWDIGLPKIFCEKGNPDVIYALFRNGRKQILSYKKNNVLFNPPNRVHGNKKLLGHWEDMNSKECYVAGESEQEIFNELILKRFEFEKIENTEYLKWKEEDERTGSYLFDN
jgi:hypothetical protein